MRNKRARALREEAGWKISHNQDQKNYGVHDKGFLVITTKEFRVYKALKQLHTRHEKTKN